MLLYLRDLHAKAVNVPLLFHGESQKFKQKQQFKNNRNFLLTIKTDF